MLASSEIRVCGITELADSKHLAFVSSCVYNGKRFQILVTDDPPPGCDREQAIELGYLKHLNNLGQHDGTDPEKLDLQFEYQEQVAYDAARD